MTFAEIPPTKCHHCKSQNIKLVEYAINGQSFNAWKCFACNAQVNCHKNSDIPMGYMAQRQIRQKRRKCHILFDEIWQKRYMERKAAYIWFANRMGVEVAHISHFSEKLLDKALNFLSQYLEEHKTALERRKQKSKEQAKKAEKNERIETERKRNYGFERKRRKFKRYARTRNICRKIENSN